MNMEHKKKDSVGDERDGAVKCETVKKQNIDFGVAGFGIMHGRNAGNE